MEFLIFDIAVVEMKRKISHLKINNNWG